MIGNVLLNKYRVIKELGSGGCGIVYLVEHINLHIHRAVKCIPKSQPMYQQALHESNILSNLKHGSIPILYDCEEDDDMIYLVMEYCNGSSLRAWKLSQKIVSEDTIIHIALQICEVIQYLHHNSQPILYLDLKPDNIIISENTIKLIDFGTAIYANQVNDMNYVKGTIGYAAPELYSMEVIDSRCDIYGIGMILYFMITGVQFHKDVKQLKNIDTFKQYSLPLRKVVNQCLHRNPTLRYQSVQEVRKALEKIKEEGRKKDTCKRRKEASLTLAIAGTQSRIGTTHIALTLAKYISRYYRKCLYMESHRSVVAKDIVRHCEGKEKEGGVYQVKSNYIRPWYELDVEGNYSDYPYTIQDYGVLSENNYEEFEHADVKFLVIGTKPWEHEQAEKTLRLLQGENIYILANSSSLEDCNQLSFTKGLGNLVRVPYLNGLLTDTYEGYILDFVRKLVAQSEIEGNGRRSIHRYAVRLLKHPFVRMRRRYEAIKKS